ncbi:MAG: ferrous iron transport protein B [Kiritimatiellae bacterium]|nr:ferrous iron transport protein B [Kiritimatiellia bacterium]
MADRIHLMLAGNPNSGKTTLFNALTGARQRVANYPGVTVETKEGLVCRGDAEVRLCDLPGTYSLSAVSDEERIARRALLEERPDAVIDVVDASNLERHLYLGVQLMELGLPVVYAFNMSDRARSAGLVYDLGRLSALLGGAIVPTVASRGEGVKDLLDAAIRRARESGPVRLPTISYGPEVDAVLEELTGLVRAARLPEHEAWPPARWVALKMLEGDSEVRMQYAECPGLREAADAARERLRVRFREDVEILLAERRYGFISGACQEAARSTAEWRHSHSDRMDEVLAHPALGLPIFFALMYAVFFITFRFGAPPMEFLERGLAAAGEWIGRIWPEGQWPLLKSLVLDGILSGVGGVLVFVPNILLLFMCIAVLEDTGYMARAAFIMDRAMHKIGLHGKSFIPLLIGFGCTVPAILATRTIESRRDRLTTILVLPLISCGARLPIYTLLIPAFFPEAWRAPMLWFLYLIGMALALLAARVLRRTIFRGESDPFVMELPPYRAPTVRGVLLQMWEHGGQYVRKAGTIILAVSIVLWALATFPRLPGERARGLDPAAARTAALEYSAAGRIGLALEPALRPMGLDGRVGTAMIGAFAAKEVFVAQLGIVFAAGDAEGDPAPLRERLRAAYTPLQGFSMLLFMLIATPCVATVAATRRESGSWKWALFQFGGLTLLGWVLSTLVYQTLR